MPTQEKAADAATDNVETAQAKRCTDAEKVKKGDQVELFLPMNGNAVKRIRAQVLEVGDDGLSLGYETDAGPQRRDGCKLFDPDQRPQNRWQPFPKPDTKAKAKAKGGK